MAIAQVEAMVAAIELLQACSRIGDAYTLLGLRRPVREAGPIVLDSQHQAGMLAASDNLEPAWLSPRSDAVPDGILHQRLQEQVRHGGCERAGLDIHVNAQPAPQAGAFDFQVG